MHVEDLKRWHWALAGVCVGLAISFAWSGIEWQQGLKSIPQPDFESGLLTPPDKYYALLNVTVLPPVEGKHLVVAEQVNPGAAPGVGQTEPVFFVAYAPYHVGGNRANAHPTVLDYLAKAKASNPKLEYRYAWFHEPWAVYALWTGASVLLIGGVWPSVISLMTGAGLGLQRADKGPAYDLSRFKGGPEKKPAHAQQPTAADMDHLRKLEEELERKLAAQQMGVPMPEDEESAAAAAAPRKLDGGPLEQLAGGKPPEEHEFGGEFYPVDRGAKKKHE